MSPIEFVCDVLTQFPNPNGDRITEEFHVSLEPILGGLTTNEMFEVAGMLLFLGNDAEARCVAEYAVTREALP